MDQGVKLHENYDYEPKFDSHSVVFVPLQAQSVNSGYINNEQIHVCRKSYRKLSSGATGVAQKGKYLRKFQVHITNKMDYI